MMSPDRGAMARMIEKVPRRDIWTGWLAFAVLAPLEAHGQWCWTRRRRPGRGRFAAEPPALG